MSVPTTPTKRYQDVTRRLAEAARRAGRDPATVNLLAVSKRKPSTMIAQLAQAGQRAFGENYLQEALPKIEELRSLDVGQELGLELEWHFIGRIQSNKTQDIARAFSWVHTVDRLKIAQRLATQRPPDQPPLNVCIEVNLSNEPSKAGIPLPDVVALALQVQALPGLKLRGLMALPAPVDNPQAQASALNPLTTLYKEMNSQGFAFDTLSIGTTHDFEAAISEGATIVRIGTALFGPREPT